MSSKDWTHVQKVKGLHYRLVKLLESRADPIHSEVMMMTMMMMTQKPGEDQESRPSRIRTPAGIHPASVHESNQDQDVQLSFLFPSFDSRLPSGFEETLTLFSVVFFTL